MRDRNNRIRAWLSDAEHARFLSKVRRSGLGKETFIRQLIENGEVRHPPSVDYIRLTNAVNHVGNNVNQIAHVANTNGFISQSTIHECLRLQRELIKIVRELR
jgi:hypothetical protein